jgi:hypothetical protein
MLLKRYMYKIKCFFRSIRNLARWFKTIWQDNDWDYYYINQLLITKLTHMIVYFENNGHFTCSQRDIELMKTTLKLLNKLQDGYYVHEPDQYFAQDYTVSPDGKVIWNNQLEYDNLGVYFDKYRSTYSLVIEKLKKEPRYTLDPADRDLISALMAQELEKKATRLAYKIIGEYSSRWWV